MQTIIPLIGMLLSSHVAYAADVPPDPPQIVSIVSEVASPHTLTIREMVDKEFSDVPRMDAVINCESGFNQFKHGKVLQSDTSDVGVGQIHSSHWKEASDLGLDIFNNVEDNIKMMRIIYDRQGIGAWTCSRKV